MVQEHNNTAEVKRQMELARAVMKRRRSAQKALAVDEAQWAIAEKIMEEDRAILSQLAKK